MRTSTTAKCSARMLLAAWDRADPPGIWDAAARADRTAPASSLEAEKMEVIRAAAAVLRRWAEGSETGANLEASLDLLRHLADFAFTAGAAPETRACVRR